MREDTRPRRSDDDRLRALMVAYQGGDLAAFEQLYALLAPPLGRWLRARLGDADRAEDLLQEAFLQIHRARHTYDRSYPVGPWAYAIARHVWLMHRRTESRRVQPRASVEEMNLAVHGDAEAFARRHDVRNALASVSPERRRALIWHHVLGLRFREIARRLRIRETAAKLRSSRGMAELRARLRARQTDDHG